MRYEGGTRVKKNQIDAIVMTDGKQQQLYKRTLWIVILSQIFSGAGLAAGITVGALMAKDMLGGRRRGGYSECAFHIRFRTCCLFSWALHTKSRTSPWLILRIFRRSNRCSWSHCRCLLGKRPAFIIVIIHLRFRDSDKFTSTLCRNRLSSSTKASDSSECCDGFDNIRCSCRTELSSADGAFC